MFSTGEDVEAHALRQRGWTISAIARHLGRDRKTVRDHLSGKRQAGVRRRSEPDPLERFVPYLTARFADDAHVWGSALYDEVVELGYGLSYPSFVRQVRVAGLRPRCEACSGVVGRDTIDIPHPPGEEIQWDWPAAPVTLGRGRLRPARHAAPLGPLPGGARSFHGPGAPDRGDGRRAAPSRRHATALARRPHGNGDRAGERPGAGELRSRREALWRDRGPVPAPAGQSEGLGN